MKINLLIGTIFFIATVDAQISPNYIIQPSALAAADPTTKFDIIGGGAIATSGTEGTGQAQATGATGISFYKEGVFQGNVIFNLATNETQDFSTTKKNGAVLLIPGNSGKSFQIDFRHYNLFKKQRLGFNFSFNASSGNWKYLDTSFDANLISSKLQLSYLLVNPHASPKINIMLTCDLGLTYRGIFGDASQEEYYRQLIFNTDKNHFLGAELNFDLWLNDIRFYFSFPYILGHKVRGLTNGQFIIGGAVSGKVFKNIFK